MASSSSTPVRITPPVTHLICETLPLCYTSCMFAGYRPHQLQHQQRPTKDSASCKLCQVLSREMLTLADSPSLLSISAAPYYTPDRHAVRFYLSPVAAQRSLPVENQVHPQLALLANRKAQPLYSFLQAATEATKAVTLSGQYS